MAADGGESRAELKFRRQFAERFPSDEALSNALDNHEALCNALHNDRAFSRCRPLMTAPCTRDERFPGMVRGFLATGSGMRKTGLTPSALATRFAPSTIKWGRDA